MEACEAIFPITRFLTDFPNTPFVALYLSAKKVKNRRWLGGELFDIFLEGDERTVVDKNLGSVVVIDASPIGTIDFRMEDIEKEFLLKIGRAAALTFLHRQNLDDGPDQNMVNMACNEAEKLRVAVRLLRTRKRTFRFILSFLTLVLVGFAYFIGPGVWRIVEKYIAGVLGR